MTCPVSLCITLGIGGARSDFVAGWLGSLPTFVDNTWTIDPVTGRSLGQQQLLRDLDSKPNPCTQDLHNSLSRSNKHFDPQAKYCFSSAIHGFRINDQITADQLPGIKFIRIDTTDVDRDFLNWEFCVKTYGYYDNRFHTVENGLPNYHIDHEITNCPITDHDRCKLFEKKLKIKLRDPVMPKFPHTVIHYNDVISPRGSKKLAQLLEIDVDPAYHRLWEKNLELSFAPDSIDLFGQTWIRPR